MDGSPLLFAVDSRDFSLSHDALPYAQYLTCAVSTTVSSRQEV